MDERDMGWGDGMLGGGWYVGYGARVKGRDWVISRQCGGGSCLFTRKWGSILVLYLSVYKPLMIMTVCQSWNILYADT